MHWFHEHIFLRGDLRMDMSFFLEDYRSQKEYKNNIEGIKSNLLANQLQEKEWTILLDIYKSYMLYVSNVQNRRWKQYPVFITILMAIISVCETVLTTNHVSVFFALCSVFISAFWVLTVHSNKIEIDVKFDILTCLEAKLPVKIFEYERRLYGICHRPPNILLEKILSYIFLMFSLVYFFYKL